ncbi:MAG TPA: S9 family peptidase [Thermoanaerobaculia bacterium]
MKKSLLAVFLILAVSAAARTIDVDDIMKTVNVSDPQISPDGKLIAVVVSRPNVAEDRFDSEIVLVEVASGKQRTLTYDRKHVSSPRWSPSGDRLAFLAEAPAAKDKEPSLQIYVMAMSGGDAMKVTSSPTGVQHFAWRPDGNAFAFVAADEAPERKDRAKHEDAFEVGNLDYLAKEMPMSSHVWMINADGSSAKRLTSGGWSLPTYEPPGPIPSPLSWSPDGKLLLITKQETPVYGDNDRATIQVLDVATGATRALTKNAKFEATGVFSPDGTRVAYLYPRDGDLNNETEIFVTSINGGDAVDATRGIDRSILRQLWMPDGKSLLVGGHDATATALWLQPIGGPARKLDLGDISPSWSFWVDMSVGRDGAVAFTGSEPQRARELYYVSSVDAKPRRLTSYNDWVDGITLGKVERVTWKNDGFDEDGVVVYPPDFQPNRKYPLVLFIHGGPQASSARTFSVAAQAMAARGWIVFSPNYRGSDNLGNAYERAIFNDSGAGPGRDVMAGIAALEQRGIIDRDRIAVSGWSYGGYMTSWMIGHYNIWKAAVSGAAVNNLVHEYSLSDNSVTVAYGMGGSPYDPKYARAYVEQSPITYASKIRTPTLIISDTGDTRVPATQSFEMYHALKDNGLEVKFIAYPVSGHFPGDPVRSADVYRRWIDWIATHFNASSTSAAK